MLGFFSDTNISLRGSPIKHKVNVCSIIFVINKILKRVLTSTRWLTVYFHWIHFILFTIHFLDSKKAIQIRTQTQDHFAPRQRCYHCSYSGAQCTCTTVDIHSGVCAPLCTHTTVFAVADLRISPVFMTLF